MKEQSSEHDDAWDETVGSSEPFDVEGLTDDQVMVMHEQGRGGEAIARRAARIVDVAELKRINKIPESDNPPNTRGEVVERKQVEIDATRGRIATLEVDIAERRTNQTGLEDIGKLLSHLEAERTRLADLTEDVELLS